MLQPKRTKYRKAHKGRIRGDAKGGYSLTFGAYGLKALTPGGVSARQIEAHFLSLGCKGGDGGGSTATKFVYAYKITSQTRP